jgi:1,4-alpha-glucan branching enzyme
MDDAYAALLNGTHGDPFAALGPHGGRVTVLAPGAGGIKIISRQDHAPVATMQPAADGLFTANLPEGTPYLLQIDWGETTQITEDPYSFGPLLSDYDLFLLGEGHGIVPRRAGDGGGRHRRRALRALGAECPARLRGRPIQ